MNHFLPLLATCAFLAFAPFSEASPLPVAQKDFVTRITSETDFKLDGTDVHLTPQTRYITQQDEVRTTLPGAPKLWLGRFFEVDGIFDKQSHRVIADEITEILRPAAALSGTAIVDLIPPAVNTPSGNLLRADGYLLLIPDSMRPTFHEPLTSTKDLRTNIWLNYHGIPRPDGVVVLDKAEFYPNTVEAHEKKLRVRSEFDAAAVTPDMKQGAVSKYFLGVDAKRIPAWHDPAMQSRIEQIGIRLIPAYQLALSESDPTRIDFRFQLVDSPKSKDSCSLDSGIILVPYQIVERLHDDSQLAAVLADSIAETIEEQEVRALPAKHAMTTSSIVGTGAGFIVPGAGIATSFINYKVKKVMFTHAQQQSARVSLYLMHDAGFDIEQAPRAWWILGTKPGKDLADTDLPTHAAVVYGYLADQWRPDQVQRQSPVQPLSIQPSASSTLENTGKLLN